MTTNPSPDKAEQTIPLAARAAILVLMAGVLVYGWQSAGVTSVKRGDQPLTKTVSAASSGAGGHPAPGMGRPAAATEDVVLSAENTSPAENSTVGTVFDITPLWVIVSIILCYLLLRMRPAILQQTMGRLNEHGALLLVTLSALLLLTAALGFYAMRLSEAAVAGAAEDTTERAAKQSTKDQTVLHDFYQIMQLLNFNTEAEKLTGFLLLAAMFAALIALLAAREVLQVLFYDLLVRLQLLQANDQIIICGLGRLGRQIIETLLNEVGYSKRLIVVLERDPQNPNLKWARQKGLLLVQGDASETEDLQRVKVLKAYEVFLCAGADEANISCLTAILELQQANSNIKPRIPILRSLGRLPWLSPTQVDSHRPRCYTHIMNHDLLRAVRQLEQQHEQAVSQDRRPDIEIFSTPERTIWKLMTLLAGVKARRIADSSALVLKSNAIQESATSETWHYVLLGFGEFGRSLALSLAEQSHTESCRRVRMTICDRDIQSSRRTFLSRYAQFCQPADAVEGQSDWWRDSGPDSWMWQASESSLVEATGGTKPPGLLPLSWVCRADFLDYHEVCDDSLIDSLIARSSPPGVRVAVFVCFDDEKENFSISLRLQQKLKDRILQVNYPKVLKTAAPVSADSAESLSWPIFAWLPRQLKLARLLSDLENEEKRFASGKAADRAALNLRPNLLPFGQNYEDISYSEITHSWLDWVARLIHLVWQASHGCSAHSQLISLVRLREAQSAGGVEVVSCNPWERVFLQPWQEDTAAPDPAVVDEWLRRFESIDWDQLERTANNEWRSVTEVFRYSNRSAAIHAVLKAAVFGLQIAGRAEPGEACVSRYAVLHAVTYGKLRRLSEMEHNRWVAERLLNGWWFNTKKDGKRSRWQLTPFECLTMPPEDAETPPDIMDQREKDARIIMLVLGLIATGRLKTKVLGQS